MILFLMIMDIRNLAYKQLFSVAVFEKLNEFLLQLKILRFFAFLLHVIYIMSYLELSSLFVKRDKKRKE